MVRYSSEHKQQTRDSIVREAAVELRRSGPDKVSVALIMKRAGLTHGGFYAHFDSKEALLQTALQWMFTDRQNYFAGLLQRYGQQQGLSRYIDAYLSDMHRNHPESGCPLPALGADVSRLPQALQQAYQDGVASILQTFSQALPEFFQTQREQVARSAFAELSGAILIARSIHCPQEAGQWLRSSRESLKARLQLPLDNREGQDHVSATE